ncbi:MAG: PadR family transcriptional regulator [Firmicutes bacterium]|nr:PadR family transcriptional regulator [Bacillota bacterium]
MNKKLIKTYIPMSETFYYILLSLSEPRHGYGIIKYVGEMSGGRLTLGSGTVYGTLSKMRKDNLINVFVSSERKTVYKLTDDGRELLELEMARLKQVYEDTQKQKEFFNADAPKAKPARNKPVFV